MTAIRLPAPPHRPRALLWSAVALLATVVSFPARAAVHDAAGPPSLAGVWTLDVEKSDSTRVRTEGMRPGGDRGPRSGMGGGLGEGPMRGGMGGGRPPRGRGEGRGDGGPRARPRGPEMRLMMRPPASILIEQTDSTVVLYEQGLPIEVLVVGLPQDRAGTVEPDAPHIPASWSGWRLIALREDERGGRATQQFALNADGQSFSLTLRREPREDDVPPLELRRVYRRDE